MQVAQSCCCIVKRGASDLDPKQVNLSQVNLFPRVGVKVSDRAHG